MRTVRLAATAVLASTLAACASLAPAPPIDQQREFAPVNGRFSALYQLPQRFERPQLTQGSFVLHSSGTLTTLDLVSPFGQTLARISVAAATGAAVLESSDGQVHQAASVESLTEDLLGWRVPVRQLVGWVDGRALGEVRGTDAQGRLREAADSRWLATVDEWGDEHPRRLTLRWPEPGTEQASDGGARVRIRLVIDR